MGSKVNWTYLIEETIGSLLDNLNNTLLASPRARSYEPSLTE
jgi:hypothetical protein